jgi:poly-gamma-glutamate synthesis protein (capsule biosynthesis protein)
MDKRMTSLRIILAAFLFAATANLFGCVGESSLQHGNVSFDSDPAQSQPPTPIDTPSDDSNSRDGYALISFAGDCTLSNIQGMSDFNAVYNSEGAAYFLGGVYDIFANDDLTVVNLEGPLTNATGQIDKPDPPNFWFKSPPEYVNILKEGSVEACNFANNHTMDYGEAGYDETLATLTDAGIDFFGYDEGLVREVNGIKIGFFGFAFDSNTDNIYWAIEDLKANGAEVIVAYFHDGIEKTYSPTSSQITAAHAAIDYGASAVIMSHPHVIQGTEEYNGAFIAYSLGNFCYGGHTNPDDKDSMIVQLEFIRTDTEITCSPNIIPCSITSTSGMNDYRPSVLTGDEAERVLNKIEDMSL